MGKSWDDVAVKCGVGPVTLAAWLAGESRPGLNHALDIAEFLGWSDTRRIAERVR